MLIHQYVAKAVQDDAPRAGEQTDCFWRRGGPAWRTARVWFPPLP